MMEHYLKAELYERVRTDPEIFDFLQLGALDGLWYWDLTSPEHEWLSPKFKEVFGFADHEMEHSPEWWQANIHPDDLQEALANFEAHKRDPKHPYDQIVRYRHRDGRTIWVRCRGLIIRDDSGAPIRMIGAHTDVTELKIKEEELARAKDAAEEAARAKVEFLANMSHEIRTPLTGIVGMLELLSRSPLSEAQQEQIGIAQQSAKTLTAVINGILDLTTIQSGNLKLAQESFDAGLLFGQVAAVMDAKAKAKGLEFHTTVRPSACRMIEGDPDRITQIIYNLLGNAIKFTEAGSVRLTISCQDVEESLDEGSEDALMLVIAVSDTGIGIAPDDQARIFKRFEQVDCNGRGSRQGTGLGLAIVSDLIKTMNGAIAVDSTVGVGSRFTCSIMVRPGRDRLAMSPANADPMLAGICKSRILIADDNTINQKMMTAFLDTVGIGFRVVNNGQAAVEACTHDHFDLILMDMHMPYLDGVAATTEIRALNGHYARIPIIALTANVLAEDVKRCREAGMTDHLGKPFSFDQLSEILHRHLASERRFVDETNNLKRSISVIHSRLDVAVGA